MATTEQKVSKSGLQRADVHIHTRYSDGYLEPAAVVEEAVRIGLNAVAITDHDTIASALIAQEYARQKGYSAKNAADNKKYPLEFIPGIEISSVDGHILAWYITEDIQPGLSAEETLYEVHRQGGLAAAAHPGQRFTTSLNAQKLTEIYLNANPMIKIDGSEVLSSWTSRIPFMRPINKSGKLFDHLGYAMGAPIGSSDAHFKSIGLGETHYPLGMSFREAVENNATTAIKTDMAEIRNIGQMAWFLYETARWTMYEDPKRSLGFFLNRLRKGSR